MTRMTSPPTRSTDQAVFAAEPPKLSTQDAVALARQYYGLSVQADVLTSERDQNFRLKTADGQSYVLKVTHPAEDPAVTDFQTRAQLWLMRADASLPLPHLRPGLDGAYLYRHPTSHGDQRAVRLIDFAEGLPLNQTPRTASQGQALGRALAQFDLALAGFDHPRADHVLLWDQQHANQLADLLPLIREPEHQQLATRHFQRFVHDVQPRLQGLRRQVIHNDLNAYNVMVSAQDTDRVTAILDFGDMVRAPLVQDLAVACAYLLEDAPDPFGAAARHCIASYHQVLPLTDEELSLLPSLIAARQLITVLITGWRAEQHPENRPYILRNNGLSWTGLARLDALAPDAARDRIFNACLNPLENAE